MMKILAVLAAFGFLTPAIAEAAVGSGNTKTTISKRTVKVADVGEKKGKKKKAPKKGKKTPKKPKKEKPAE